MKSLDIKTKIRMKYAASEMVISNADCRFVFCVRSVQNNFGAAHLLDFQLFLQHVNEDVEFFEIEV